MPTVLFPPFSFCKKSTENNASNRENQPVNNVDSVICGKRIECVHDNAVFENANIKAVKTTHNNAFDEDCGKRISYANRNEHKHGVEHCSATNCNKTENEIDASVPRHILRNIELSSLITEFPVQTVIIEITPRKNNAGIIDMRYADAVFVTNSVDLPIGREPYKSALRLLCRYE